MEISGQNLDPLDPKYPGLQMGDSMTHQIVRGSRGSVSERTPRRKNSSLSQGCQMVYFQTQIPILGKFWMVVKWKELVYFMALWSVLRPFGIIYGHL
jgi:hypothetical protein